jgi:small-conductance mechanosensitive channel
MADDDDQWRFSIDDVGPDDEDEGATTGTGGEDDDGPTVALGGLGTGQEATDEGGNVAGTIAPDVAVEPGMPDFENVLFATVGAIFTAIVLAGLVAPLDLTTVATIAGVIGVGAGLLYVLFRQF